MDKRTMRPDLIARYADERLPRYTSYPTAPHFSAEVGSETYARWLGTIPPASRRFALRPHPVLPADVLVLRLQHHGDRPDEPMVAYIRRIGRGDRLVDHPSWPQRSRSPIVHFGGGTPTIVAARRVLAAHRHDPARFDLRTEPRSRSRSIRGRLSPEMIGALSARPASPAPASASRASIRRFKRRSTGSRASPRPRAPSSGLRAAGVARRSTST